MKVQLQWSLKSLGVHLNSQLNRRRGGVGRSVKMKSRFHNLGLAHTLIGSFVSCLKEEEARHVHELIKFNVALRYIFFFSRSRKGQLNIY